MGTLTYAILGLLSQQSRTGYELKKEFESTLNEFWSAKHSQIYPELSRLTEAGLVEYTTEITGTALERKRYALTPAGKAAFYAWLEQRHKMPPTPKDEFRLQLFFSGCLEPARRLDLLRDQLHQHRARLEHLQKNQEKFHGAVPEEANALCDYLVLLGAIMREEAACAWLERCIALTEDMQPNPSEP